MLTSDVTVVAEILVQKNQNRGQDTEKSTESKNNKVTNTFRQRRLASKEGFSAKVLFIERGDNSKIGHVECFYRVEKRKFYR